MINADVRKVEFIVYLSYLKKKKKISWIFVKIKIVREMTLNSL